MSVDEAPGADMLPGLRAAVDDARAKAARTRRRKAAEWEAAEVDPIAQVLLDVPLAHLDRPFDYAVPAALAETALPGVRVKARFAGSDVDGFVVARVSTTAHTGRLQPLRKVVSPEPVLAHEIAELSGLVAQRWAGTRADVVRLAVPPRHAATEKQESTPGPKPGVAVTDAWAMVEHAPAFLSHVAAGGAPRAVWGAAPGDDWPVMLAQATSVAHAAGRGVLVCVPDQTDVRRLDAAMSLVLGKDQHAVLTAESGPSARYGEFLSVSRGARRVVIGTRSAALAPVHELGLVAMWDDGDDQHAEPRAPYPHAREMLLMRAQHQGAAMLLGGFARSVEAHHLVETGWAHELDTPRAELRQRLRVTVVPEVERGVARRIPQAAIATMRAGLEQGPVLVQTPRAGYAPSLACERCRTPARCAACAGPLALPGAASPPRCRWCDREEASWRCAECGHRGLRTPVRGGERTAEELGRMFPGVTVRSSHGERRLQEVGRAPAIVVATVGAEPVADGGYAAVVVLDTWLGLTHDSMRASEEAVRRWMGAMGLVRAGGAAVVVGDPALPALQTLVRWDPAGFARREAAERAQAHLPPAARIATITGGPGAVDDALTILDLPQEAEVLGPVPEGERVRVVLRVPRQAGAALAQSLGEMQRVRAARKLDPVRVQVDPGSI